MAVTTLSVTFQGAGANLYVVIRRRSDTYVWNGTSFEAFADGSIASYDVALTDQGGDYYTVSFPSAVPAGQYRAMYYERAGASPATTDLHLASEDVDWDGTGLSSGGSVTIGSYALTTLESVKRHMAVSTTSHDDRLRQHINAVSAEIERVTGTKIKARDWRLWLNADLQTRLVLPYRPVQRITKISYGRANALTITYSGAAIEATAGVYSDPESYTAGGVRLVTIAAAGTETANSLTFASYPTASTLATAINLVGGWTATVQQDVRATDLHVTGMEDAKSRTVTLTYPDRRISSYRVDARRGHVEFDTRAFGDYWPTDEHYGRRHFPRRAFQEVCVLARLGYETIPADVEQVCNDLVKEVFMLSTSNTGVSSAKLGVYSISFNPDQANQVRTRLASYMDGTSYVGALI